MQFKSITLSAFISLACCQLQRKKRLVSVKSKNVCVKQRLFLSHTVCKMDCSTTAVVQQQQKNYRQETESHKSDKKEGNTQTTLMQRAALLLCEMHFLFFAFLLTLATLVLMCQNGKEKNPKVTFQNIFVMLHQLVLAWVKCINQCENAKIQVCPLRPLRQLSSHKTFQLKSLMKDFALAMHCCCVLQMAWQKVVLVVYDNAFKPLCNAQWIQSHLKIEYHRRKSLNGNSISYEKLEHSKPFECPDDFDRFYHALIFFYQNVDKLSSAGLSYKRPLLPGERREPGAKKCKRSAFAKKAHGKNLLS